MVKSAQRSYITQGTRSGLKKLYFVSVEFEYPVLAENEHEAMAEAEAASLDLTSLADYAHAKLVTFKTNGQPTYLPDGYTVKSLVYGVKGDVTLGEALAEEKIRQRRDALMAKQQDLFPLEKPNNQE